MQYDIMASDLGPIFIACDGKRITRVHFLDSTKPLSGYDSRQKTVNAPLLQKACRQLTEYFSGVRQQFSLPLAMEGTDFQVRVWKTLTTIPYGKTWSYKELAAAIGNPTACRAVGSANGKNKLPILVPCHRVIRSNGGLGGFSSGLERKRYLIAMENSQAES